MTGLRSAGLTVRDDLTGIEGYHSPQVSVDVRLNTNESPYPPPDGWRQAFLDELATVAFHRYPDRQAVALRQALAAFHGVRPDQVFAANGSNEVLQALCLAYGGSGRTAAVFEPTYALHSHIARITGTDVVVGVRTEDFGVDLAAVRRLLVRSDASLTFLCSPNNPTGTVDAPSTTAAVVAAAPGLVVVDEAYGQFTPRSAIGQVADGVNLVVVRTFSKTWALAGLRLGYCVAPAEVVAALDAVTLPYHLDAATQAGGRLALGFRVEMEARVATLVAERDRLAAALGELPVDTWPSGANFILFRPRLRAGAAVWADLVERSVLVRDCSTWPGLEGCLRVTVGTPEEDDAFLTALAQVCR
ncbi:MAG TPA: histidinol-phosphate transaminase [Acidimicrobiales bacterium]|nr:histidinol-phosphate transaminase [Acidimicrobiales bacterium]